MFDPHCPLFPGYKIWPPAIKGRHPDPAPQSVSDLPRGIMSQPPLDCQDCSAQFPTFKIYLTHLLSKECGAEKTKVFSLSPCNF